jgi:RNA polymerase sigma factor (sigma-70 family)
MDAPVAPLLAGSSGGSVAPALEPVDDGIVVAAAVQPDFTTFYRNEFRAVVGLAYVLCGSRPAAEELAQDAFLATYRHWDRVAGYDNPGAWVRRVVANRAVSRGRRLQAETKALTRLAGRRAPTLAGLPDDAELFWTAVRALPRRQAQVVALFYAEDRSIDDIATVLAVDPGTVKTHLHLARKALAERLRLDQEHAT